MTRSSNQRPGDHAVHTNAHHDTDERLRIRSDEPPRGMAFQAMESRWDVDARSNASLQAVSHGQDAHATPWTPEYGEIEKRQGSYLPHWTADDATYSVTFRLADSLPRGVLEGFLREREAIMK